MALVIFQLNSSKYFGFLSTLILCLYYNTSIGYKLVQPEKSLKEIEGLHGNKQYNSSMHEKLYGNCYNLNIRETNITTSDVFAKFEFKPEWMSRNSYWDETFQNRLNEQFKDPDRHYLKIFLVPHSHNDPGWLRTYLEYFESESKHILNAVIFKMTKYRDLTFIWSEISFLQLWWDQANATLRTDLQELIDSGRFEITTGGWVMTDEANVHIYAMIDQLIEGHQWIKSTLNTAPTVGWSVDPFGHGATIPYLLAACDFEGTIIQRIHYAWKQWFAKHQNGDFIWQPNWKIYQKINRNILTHNMPFDIYSIQHSCGPHPDTCSKFDFRYANSAHLDIANNAKLLLKQYTETASLFSHNVALIPIGSDFSFRTEYQIDSQYLNYKKLMNYINSHQDNRKVEISFGTPKDYFNEIKKRTKKFPTLKGDFFVYSDIFNDRIPAYWSGYFSTRPFYKILCNELEHNLRSSEILFTLTYNIARQNRHFKSLRKLENDYKKLILARRNLGLFQHHDAITGTSKSYVMKDYGLRLFGSIQDTIKLQENTIGLLLQNFSFDGNFLVNELEHKVFNKLPTKRKISFKDSNVKLFVVFNSLAQKRIEIISIRTTRPNVLIMNENGLPVQQQQINPVWHNIHYKNTNNINITTEYEILFLVELPPISLLTYRVVLTDNYKNNLATLYCKDCLVNNRIFAIENRQPGDIQIENKKIRMSFDEKSGFLKSVTKKDVDLSMKCNIKFAAYKSELSKSGAYLFKTNQKPNNTGIDILNQYQNRIIITSGLLCTDVTVIYGPFLVHTARIFNTDTHLDNAIYLENDIDFGQYNYNKELIMRIKTQINNGKDPEFYSDQNGFQFQHRVKVSSIGIEGNYFPITTSAFIQDTAKRMTILTTHAQGAASLRSGELEVMLDRKFTHDDGRGVDEAISDNTLTRQKFWLFIEDINFNNIKYQVPSLFSNCLGNSLRYPPTVYFTNDVHDDRILSSTNLKKKLNFIKHDFPCDVHLLNVRTLTNNEIPGHPSRSALLLLHRQGYDCNIGEKIRFCNNTMISGPDLFFNELEIENLESTSLTGLKNMGHINICKRMLIEPMDIKTFNLTFEYETYKYSTRG